MRRLIPKAAEAKPPTNPENFEGQVMIQTLVPSEGSEIEVLAVFFQNGARTKPHVHPVDQLLVTIEGRCIVCTLTEGVEIGIGEVAFTPAGEWHWHGAVKGTDACHLSIKRPGRTTWSESFDSFRNKK